MRAMDCRLTDAHADPPGTTEHLHTERLVRLADSAWCFRPSDQSPPVSAPPLVRAGHVTFGCFNALPKITDAILALWSRILREVPQSRLLLKSPGFREPSAQSRIRAALEKDGITSDRIELLGPAATVAGHLDTLGR